MPVRTFRHMLIAVLLGLSLVIPASGVGAQSTPEAGATNPFADLGLPQIDITMTDDAFEGVPPELDAGRYVVALTVETTDEFGGGGTFMMLPEGMTADDFLELTAPSATPMMMDEAGMEASPAAGEEDMGPPDWYYQTTMAGGPYAHPGETNYAVVDLTAGEWVWWAEYPGAPQPPQPITVSGEMPADLPEPTASVTIDMSEFTFVFSIPLTSGSHVLAVPNIGEQPHFLSIVGVPEGTTVEDLMDLVEREEAAFLGTPVATPVDGLVFEDIEDVFSTGDQSAGVTAWYEIELESGTYAAACFVTDPETGMPHVMLGMLEVFTID